MSKLPNNANLLQQLMDNMTDNIFFKDRDHRFIMINQANAQWFGFNDPQEAIGKTDFDLFEEDFVQRLQADEEQVMESGEPMLGDEQQTVHNGELVWGHVTKVPLRDEAGQIIGIIGIGRDITALKRKELELAEANRKLSETARKIEADLHMAAQLQQTFLPQGYPSFVSGDGRPLLDIHHYYQADIQLGGDFCAVNRLNDTRAGFLICDVMGHGVRAALVTGIISTFAKDITKKAKSPGDYLTQLNKKLLPVLRTEEEYLFATACYLVIDVATGELTGAMAGHTLPFLIRPSIGHVAPFALKDEARGPALAIAEDHQYRDFSLFLEPGDKVLMYTDGICEAESLDGNEFGEQRLSQTLQTYGHLPLQKIVEHILEDAKTFTHGQQFGDDICLLGFTLNGLM